MDSQGEIAIIENAIKLLVFEKTELGSDREIMRASQKIYDFPIMIGITNHVSKTFSPENLFFLLFQKGYISGNIEKIKELQEDYTIGVRPGTVASLNRIRFHLTDKAIEMMTFLVQARDGVNKMKEIENQTSMDFDKFKGDQNVCHDLPVQNLVSKDLDELINMQKALQLRIDPTFCDPNESIASVARFLMKNKHAFEEEMNEMMNALGGTHDPLGNSDTVLGSGAWKWWKASNKTIAEAYTMNALSDRDKTELKMEIVDQFHFFMNEMIKVGMTGSELYSMYMAKNRENFNRQNNGY